MLNQRNLPRILFPLGNFTKKEVRKLAKQYGLPNAEKQESQEICFIPDNDYPNFLKTSAPHAFKTGPIFDTNGKILGTHHGIVNFTIGQRKGLGISKPYPLYVTKINPKNNSITVGKENDTFTKELMADEINFIHPENICTLPRNLTIKIRSMADAVPAKIIHLKKNKIKINFEKPQKAVTPGQAVVFYDGDEVIGGGTII
jgi:tRNA-specific 2-thiouridylase